MSYILPPPILNEINPDSKDMALVISPLKSLMLDRHAILLSHGISGVAVHQHQLSRYCLTEEILAGDIEIYLCPLEQL